jgi:hypothetical protein
MFKGKKIGVSATPGNWSNSKNFHHIAASNIGLA